MNSYNTNTKNKPFTITITGRFQQGKSTLLNCLLEKKYVKTGDGCVTTRCCSYFRFGTPESFRLIRNGQVQMLEDLNGDFGQEDRLEITCDHPLLRYVTLIDTPGFDARREDDETARSAIQDADAVLLMLAEKMDERDRKILNFCRENTKHVIVLFNCKNEDYWRPDDKQIKTVCEEIDAQLRDYDEFILPIARKRVFPCNVLWAWTALGHEEMKKKKIINWLNTNDLPSMSDRELLCESGIPVIRREISKIFVSLLIDRWIKNLEVKFLKMLEKYEIPLSGIS